MDDLNIVLAAQIDMTKSITNINDSIKVLQTRLKDINISFNIVGLEKEINTSLKNVEKAMKSTSNIKLSTNNQKEYYEELMDYVHKYRLELISTSEYISKLNKSIYSSSGNYSGEFNDDLGIKEQEFFVKELNNALKQQDKILGDIDKTYDNIASDEDKRLKAINDQTVAIAKMQNAFNNQNTKYSTSVDVGKSNSIQSQIDALSRLNPQTVEYQNTLKSLQLTIGNYNKDLANSAILEDKQAKALTDKSIAINKIKDKLNSMKVSYGSSVDSSTMTSINNMVAGLEKLDPLSTEYRNNLKKIQYETDKLGSESKQSFKKTQDAISDTTAKSTDLGLAIRTLGQMFMIGSPIYLAQQVFRDMASSINKMNEATTDIRLVTGMSADSVEGLKESYNKLGKEMGATTNEVLASSTEWFRQGKTIAETEDLVKASMIGSKLGKVESAQMTEYLTSSLNGYMLSSKEAISVVDKLVSVDIAAATSTSELAEAMSRTASSARMAGVDMDTLVGYIGTVSSVTRKSAETIGESFKTMFARYQNIKLGKFVEDGTMESDVIKAMDNIGISIKDGEKSLISYGEAMDELNKKWSTLSDAEKSSVANAMAGVRQRDNFIVLMDNYSQSMELAKISAESAGTSIERFGIWSEGTEAKLNKLKASVEGVFIKTLNSNTVNNLISLATESMNFVESLGGLVPILTSILGLVVAIKSASIASWITSMVSTIGATAKAIVGVQVATQGATVAMTGLQAAMGWIGIAGIAIGGIASMVSMTSDSVEELETKVQSLNGEISTLYSDKNSAISLATQYDELNKLSKSQKLTNEEQEEFTRIQNELQKLVPTVSGYFDSQNNFILTESSVLQEVNDHYKEYIDIKRKERAEASNDLYGERLSKYEKESESINKLKSDLIKLQDYKKYIDSNQQETGSLSTEDILELNKQVEFYNDGVNGAIKSTSEQIQSLSSEASKGMSLLRQDVINMATDTNSWMDSTKEQKDAMSEFIASMSPEDVYEYAKSIQTGELSVDGFVSALMTSPEVIAIMNKALEDSDTVAGEASNSFTDMAKASEVLSSKFDDVTKSAKTLSSIIKDIEDGNGLTTESMSNIISTYPELLQYIDNEATLKQKVIDKINEVEKEQSDYLNYIRFLQSETFSEMEGQVATYYNNLGMGYTSDFENYKSMEEAKAKITSELISKLNEQWMKYFNMINSINTPTIKDSVHNPLRTKAVGGLNDSIISEAEKEMTKINSEIAKRKQELSDIFSKYDFDAIDIKLDGGYSSSSDKSNKSSSKAKDDSVKQIKEYYDAQIKAIQDGRNKLDNEITKKQAEIDLFNLKGDNTKVAKLEDEMTILLEKRKQLTEKENVDYRGLQEKINLQMKSAKTEEQRLELKEQQIKLDELIESNSIGWYGDKQNQLEQDIELIERKSELEKQGYDDKIKQLELEQMLMNEDSNEYKLKEEEKLNLLVGLQQGYQDKIKQLKAQVLSNESDMVREYINLWTDAEMERLNMIKAMAEKQRQVELDSISKKLETMEKQKNAIKELTDLTIAMIKKETELKKNAIQDEIDGYAKIINKKKEALQKEQDEKDYTKELSSIEKEEKKLNDKLLELSMDNSGNVNEKRLELEEELRKLLEKKEELQNDKTLSDKQDLLDKELEAFEDEKQKELDKLNDYLDKEGQIREDALDMIKRNNKAMYDKLLEYNALYGNKMESEIIDAWGLATDAADEFNNGQMDLLDVLKSITDEMTEQVRLQTEMKDKHWTEIDTGNGGESNGNGSSSNTSGDNWHDKKDKIAKQMQSNSQKWHNASDEEKKTLAQENEKLGQQVGAWKESDGEWWIMVDYGKRMKLYDSIGVRHTGIETGFVGNKAMSKGSSDFLKLMNGEELNILKAGELVVNTKQMDNVMRNIIPNLTSGKRDSQGMKIEGGLINVVVQGDASKDTVKLLRKETERIANYTLDKIKGSMLNLGY